MYVYSMEGDENMKREWNTPVVEELSISETASGMFWTDDADGKAYNDGTGWKVPHGKNAKLS